MTPKRTAAVVVERADARHAAALAEFSRTAWGTDGGEGEGARGYVVEPTRPAWICLRDGVVIGFLGSYATEFRLHGRTVPGHWLKGFWVLPEYRSGPVGYMLLRAALQELGPVAASLVAPPARRLMAAAGVSERAVLFNRLLLLRPGRVLGRIDPERVGASSLAAGPRAVLRLLQATRATTPLGGVVAAGMACYRGPSALQARGLSTAFGWAGDGAELDALWQAQSDQVRVAAVRDAAALFTRYRDTGEYELVTVRSAGRLAGWAVVRRLRERPDERLAGLRVASLSDILFPIHSPAVGLAAVAGAERAARRAGADALLCSGTHPALESVLRARAFLPIPANLRLMARDHGSHAFAARAEDLWVTRGDGRSDETF